MLDKLPAPKRAREDVDVIKPQQKTKAVAEQPQNQIPAYGDRAQWIPKTLADFGGGGAYPEIAVAQFPLGMGRKEPPGSQKRASNALPVRTGSHGEVRHDALILSSSQSSSLFAAGGLQQHSTLRDLLPSGYQDDDEDLRRPSQDQVRETMLRTQQALSKIVNHKVAASNPTATSANSRAGTTEFVKYTPARVDDKLKIKQRVIQVVEKPQDPLAPPRFKIPKQNSLAVKRERSPPPPVMHAPAKPLSKEEHQAWHVPPCVSNWKNAQGFVIPLDKRLAADGRGLQQVTINDRFSKLSESLYIADRHAREEVERRRAVEQQLLVQQQQAAEMQLRDKVTRQ